MAGQNQKMLKLNMSEQVAGDFNKIIEECDREVANGAISAIEKFEAELNKTLRNPFRREQRIQQTHDKQSVIYSTDGKHSFRIIWRVASSGRAGIDEIRITRFQHIGTK